jgi:hypothetical protein
MMAKIACIIIPLCKPNQHLYVENAKVLGFPEYHHLPTPAGAAGWLLDLEDNVLSLSELVAYKLLPAWNKLSEVECCIESLMTLPTYGLKRDGTLIVSLVCLSAYQRTYDRCLSFIQEYREFTRSDRAALLTSTSSFQSQLHVIETVEKCILAEDYERLKEYLDEWYQKSVTNLGLTKFGKLKSRS